MKRLLRKETAGILAILALWSCAMSSCGEKDGESGKTVKYKTIEIKRCDRKVETPYTAVLKGAQTVDIRPQISGIITQICINEGSEVSKGQTLFVIDQAPYTAALRMATANVKAAEARLATARLTLKGQRKLHENKVVSDFELEEAGNRLKEAEAALEQAVAQKDKAATELAYTKVKSPVDGIAGMIAYRTGALVNCDMAEPLVSVSDNSKIYAYFSITESMMVEYRRKKGSESEKTPLSGDVRLLMANGETYSLPGKIDATSGIMDSRTGTIRVRATFPNPEKQLYDGGSGTVVMSDLKRRCVAIPQTSTVEIQDKIFVYKVVDDRAQQTEITVEDANDGKEYIVLSGLKEGDRIIAEGGGLVRDGAIIE